MNTHLKYTMKSLLAGVALLGLTSVAGAAAGLTVYDGVNPLITVVDNGPGDYNLSTGTISVITNVGVSSLATVTATTKPAIGSGTAPQMNIHITDTTSAWGSLRVVFTENGFGPFTGNLPFTMVGTVVGSGPATVTYSLYYNSANVLGATTTPIGSPDTTTLPNPASGSGLVTLGAPYSLTEVIQITMDAADTVDLTASFPMVAAVPDGGMTVALLAMSLVMVETVRRKKAKA